MDLDKISKIACAGESESVEFKKNTSQIHRIGQTLSAFLNTNSGQVLVGVSSDGKL